MKRSVLVALLTLYLLTACSWVFPPSGPFEGRVVDAISGKPIAGAFVGITWSGSNIIHGSETCLHAVLVHTDAEGRYSIPWQGYKPVKLRAVGIGWGGKVWAPGYRMRRFGQGDPLTAGILEATRDPDVSVNEGVERAKQRQVEGFDEQTTVRLEQAATTTEALDMENRMNEFDFYCGADIAERRQLAITSYKDSYRRVCIDPLTAEQMDKWSITQVGRDLGSVMALYPETYKWTDATWLEHHDFDKKSGWLGDGFGDSPALLSPELLPEYCRLEKSKLILQERGP